MRFLILRWLVLTFLTFAPFEARAEEPLVSVGTATVEITPATPIRLVGYADRKTESTGIETPLKARALAIGSDVEGAALLLAVDNLGVPARISDEVATRLGLSRERLVICSTHTHCGPALSTFPDIIFGGPLPLDQRERIDRYTRELTDALERVAIAALHDRKPARLSWSTGFVNFAANRRVLKDGRWVGFGVNPNGPVDHRLPVLRVTDADGKVRSILAGYACHCTTLGPDFNKVCGDWAGYACEAIERSHPGASALMVIGCGADANPEPRRGLDDAKRHGQAVAREVERLLGAPMSPLPGQISASYRRIQLPFGPRPTRETLAVTSKRGGPEGYFAQLTLARLDRGEKLPETLAYPVQTWSFGAALSMVFLGGEVVVDYALRLRTEAGGDRLWVVAYSNDVPCYVASERLLAEGGYEVDASMIYYGRPARLSPKVENLIIDAVREQRTDSMKAARK